MINGLKSARKKRLTDLVAPAAVAAILHFFPDLFPFFAPGEGPAASGADLGRQVFLFDVFHSANIRKVYLRTGGSSGALS